MDKFQNEMVITNEISSTFEQLQLHLSNYLVIYSSQHIRQIKLVDKRMQILKQNYILDSLDI